MSRRSSRNNRDNRNEGGGGQGWITTFSDLMSLLLTFFILLYSMSSVDAMKFKNLTNSLQSVLTGSENISIIEGSDSKGESLYYENLSEDLSIDEIAVDKEIQDMFDTVDQYICDKELDAKVSVDMNKSGVYVDIKEAILFETGKSEIKPSGVKVLEELQGLFKDFENDIVIEGHTDNIPIRNDEYQDNWALSTARASSVVRYLSAIDGLEPKRFSATGYGEHRPIVPNDTAENRSANRRVNILIIFDEESENSDGE